MSHEIAEAKENFQLYFFIFKFINWKVFSLNQIYFSKKLYKS